MWSRGERLVKTMAYMAVRLGRTRGAEPWMSWGWIAEAKRTTPSPQVRPQAGSLGSPQLSNTAPYRGQRPLLVIFLESTNERTGTLTPVSRRFTFMAP